MRSARGLNLSMRRASGSVNSIGLPHVRSDGPVALRRPRLGRALRHRRNLGRLSVRIYAGPAFISCRRVHRRIRNTSNRRRRDAPWWRRTPASWSVCEPLRRKGSGRRRHIRRGSPRTSDSKLPIVRNWQRMSVAKRHTGKPVPNGRRALRGARRATGTPVGRRQRRNSGLRYIRTNVCFGSLADPPGGAPQSHCASRRIITIIHIVRMRTCWTIPWRSGPPSRPGSGR
jgi:hypothetical protein